MIYPNQNYKCIIYEGKCQKTEKYCSDWKYGEDEYSCTSLSPKDKSKICSIVNDSCIEQYKYCEDYLGKDKEICESIEPYDKNEDRLDYSSKCVIKENKCVKEIKTCRDYNQEKDKTYCTLIQLEDDSKKCFYYKKQCIEEYQSCEKYLGNDKNICESIVIYDEYNFEIDFSKKCVLKDNACTEQKKFCSEFESQEITDENFCSKLSAKDPNKKCFYYNNKCIEDYEYCELYSYYGDEVIKDICESIIPIDYKNTKCVFNKDECISKKKTCNYYNPDLIKNQCEKIYPDISKKCEYSNGDCIEKIKYCSEINNVIDKKICENAPVNGKNKICSYDKVEKKCEEIEDPDGSDKRDEKNSSKKIHLSKFFIFTYIIYDIL